MAIQPQELDSILCAAIEITSPEQQAAYLDDACGGDRDLRAKVLKLLRAHDRAGGFLAQPIAGDRPTEVLAALTDPESWPPALGPPAQEISLDFLESCDAPGRLGKLGPYEVIEVIGYGGMGVVLKAHDTRLNRTVAVKVLAPQFAAHATARRRFLREAQAAAAVTHPHLITIHAVDENDHTPYLVMEFVDGMSLREKIDREGPLELREILRIGSQIAAGLAAAHAHGLIHRDIKPANILLENGVERVKITDFGLARAIGDLSITRAGEVAGTPQYMSPEQASGKAVDHRSDLFSLGSVLYAMCTGLAAFRAEGTMAVLHRVCNDTPRAIREVNPDIPRWLAAIVDRLLAKDPDDRVQSAEEVADLLAQCLAYVQHPTLTTGPPKATSTRLEEIVGPDFAASITKGTEETSDDASEMAAVQPRPRRKGQTRRPRIAAHWLMATAALLLVGLLAVAEGTGVTHFAGTVIRLVTGEGTLIVEIDDPTIEVSIDGQDVTIRGGGVEELHLTPGQYKFTATKDGKPIKQQLISITRGGKETVRVSLERPSTATADSVPLSVDADATRWTSLFNGKDLTGWKTHPDAPGGWSVEEGVLVGRSRKTYLFTERGDYENFHLRIEAKINEQGNSGIFFRSRYEFVEGAPGGIFPAGYEAVLDGVTLNEGQATGRLKKLTDILDGKRTSVPTNDWFTVDVIAMGNEFVVKMNDEVTASYVDDNPLNTGHLALQVFTPQTTVQFRKIEIRELPQGPGVAVGTQESPSSEIAVVEESRLLAKHEESVYIVALSPNGRLAAAAGGEQKEDGTYVPGTDFDIRLWNVESGELVHRLSGHTSSVYCLAFSPEGRYVISGSRDMSLRLWDVATGKEIKSFQAHTNTVQCVAISPDSRFALSGGHDGRLIKWSVEDDRQLWEQQVDTGLVYEHVWCVAFSPDGSMAVSGHGNTLGPGSVEDEGGHLRLWNAETGEEIRRLEGHTRAPRGVAFTPDGKRVVSAGHDRTIRTWNVASGKEVGRIDHDNFFTSLALTPDGSHLLTVGPTSKRVGRNGLVLWNLLTGRPTHVLSEDPRVFLHGVAVSPDGRLALSGGWDGTVRLWRMPGLNAFVVLGSDGAEHAEFDTLAEAAAGSSAGDTIEIRGNGPFQTDGVITSHPLTIRAGAGFRPVIQAPAGRAIDARAPLVLEGLTLQSTFKSDIGSLVATHHHSLRAANCRFVSSENAYCLYGWMNSFSLLNCELIAKGELALAINWAPKSRKTQEGRVLQARNCLMTGKVVILAPAASSSVELNQSTLIAPHPILRLEWEGDLPAADNGMHVPIKIEADENIIDSRSVFNFCHTHSDAPVQTARVMEELLPKIVNWREHDNLLGSTRELLVLTAKGDVWQALETEQCRDLEGWMDFWGLPETGTRGGAIRFSGGDMHARALSDPDRLTPEDFRQRPDSYAYKAGPNGKDLGADVALVGPGKAYERWKQTPAYNEWLKETRALISEATTSPDSNDLPALEASVTSVHEVEPGEDDQSQPETAEENGSAAGQDGRDEHSDRDKSSRVEMENEETPTPPE